LPQAQVGEWAGFVFINPNPDNTETLEEFLGEIVDQFEVWNLDKRYKQAHVAKVIHANWKIAQEAFCEAYHVNATHPQIMPYLGDTNSQIDVWDNFSRVITPAGITSPLLDWEPTPDEMMRTMMDVRHDQESPMPIDDSTDMRAVAAQASRERWREFAGDEWVDSMSDAEMMDSIDYTVFPNFHPWGAAQTVTITVRRSWNASSWPRTKAIRRRPRLRSTGWKNTRPSPMPPNSACSARSSTRTCSTWPRYKRVWK
jgi:phenylpropionate dioxygenase-like ring-hydroxylating dioxygenase large terminal subunit